MTGGLSREVIRAIDWVNRKGKSVGVRLVHHTGKSPFCIHPKHLIQSPWHDWYIEHLKPSDIVLDLGCANGAHTLKAAAQCKRIVAFDYDVNLLSIARHTADAEGFRNAHFFAWDVTGQFPFPDKTFDRALFLDVIEHLVPRISVLQEIHRVLKDDGRLFVSGPNRDTSWRQRLRSVGLFAFSDPDHKVEYTQEEFIAELRAGGFKVVGDLMPVVYDTPWTGLIDVIGGISLSLYAYLARWKHEEAVRRPSESSGFRAIAMKASIR